MNKIKAGDPASQRVLYDGMKAELFVICRRYSRDESTAKDMFQEGFIRIYRDFHQFDQKKGSLRGWVRRVMVNSCLQYIRSQKRHWQTSEIAASSDDNMSYVDGVISKLSLKEIFSLIKKMPEGYQLVFNLYLIEGYSHKEIARHLEISTNTSKSQLFKAKNWLRQQLKQLDPTISKKYGRQFS